MASTVDIPAAVTTTGAIVASAGTVSAPSYSFENDDDTGMYLDSGEVKFTSNNSEVLSVSSSGVIGTVPVYGRHIGFRANFSAVTAYVANASYFAGKAAEYDTESGYNNTNGVYTIPITGYWKFETIVRMDTTNLFEIQWNRNGGAENSLEIWHDWDASIRRTEQSILQRFFNAGDTVYPYGNFASANLVCGDYIGRFLGT